MTGLDARTRDRKNVVVIEAGDDADRQVSAKKFDVESKRKERHGRVIGPFSSCELDHSYRHKVSLLLSTAQRSVSLGRQFAVLDHAGA
jgi:hypothetical protein